MSAFTGLHDKMASQREQSDRVEKPQHFWFSNRFFFLQLETSLFGHCCHVTFVITNDTMVFVCDVIWKLFITASKKNIKATFEQFHYHSAPYWSKQVVQICLAFILLCVCFFWVQFPVSGQSASLYFTPVQPPTDQLLSHCCCRGRFQTQPMPLVSNSGLGANSGPQFNYI